MATDAITGQPIFKGSTAVGLRNVGSYQISGHPYMTGALIVGGLEHKVSFPYITKKITVTLSGTVDVGKGNVRITFVPTGSDNMVTGRYHYAFLDSHEDSQDFDVKCKEIYISSPAGATLSSGASFFVYASLTSIPTSSMYALTGSGINSAT